ncbi:isoleucine--tRNA ligase [Candidatus Legionella polyplacis]|uniref:Isoleucine--tRNA ligase n=1 Tax=Candidatus Legionella polyplacis TaxID=2005262 RepID=A0ABZ2H083_9GAMM
MTKKYKDTLNLPYTLFPMKANLIKREYEILLKWNSENIYKKIKQHRMKCENFVLHDGPPYANGDLHCGHALNKILKDIVLKTKIFSNFNINYIPGWDCHGLPIELNIEKKFGKCGKNIDFLEFRKECYKYAKNQISFQKKEFKRLGIFSDWDSCYLTMNQHYVANVIRVLRKVIQEGYLEYGFKPIYWCIDCNSSLAEAEIEYDKKQSFSIDVAFFLVNVKKFFSKFCLDISNKPIIVPIWTTTPWTLPSNEAVCLNSNAKYSLIETYQNYFLISCLLIDDVMKRYSIVEYKVILNVNAKELEYFLLFHPFYSRKVPIILDNHISVSSGTGCVHIASAHGPEDYLIGKKYNLNIINTVSKKGYYFKDINLLGGISALKADKKIIEILEKKNNLLYQTFITHNYPHCWRHKTPVIYLATPQWFISMDKNKLREKIIENINKVQWIPSWGKNHMIDMINKKPDWCISRQRVWGTPIPLFIHKTTKTLHPDTDKFLKKISNLIEENGIDSWLNLDLKLFLGSEYKEYIKINDVLDVWFDSGTSYSFLSKKIKNFIVPVNLYLEGYDQYRGWFNSSLTISTIIDNCSPYQSVLTHGYILDSKGEKFSKSAKNYVNLKDLINQYGSDILRLLITSIDYRNEINISDENIRRIQEAYRRIRNTIRYILANLFDFEPEKHLVFNNALLVEIDRWIIFRCMRLQKEVIKAYDQYNFHIVYQKIYNFCLLDMSGFYLDIIKDRQYTNAKESKARRSCQTAMFHIVHSLTRMLAPILSFTSEEIWKNIPGSNNDSIFIQSWYDKWPNISNVKMYFWDEIQKLRNQVNKELEKQRVLGIIKSSLETEVMLYVNREFFLSLQRIENELKFILLVSSVKIFRIDNEILDQFDTNIKILIKKSKYKKCERCWHRSKDIGNNLKYLDLCNRCIGNMTGNEEQRIFA